MDAGTVRSALASLPEGTSHGERPAPEHVYLLPSHVKAMDPDNLLVTGTRGAGKTFWWSALQDRNVRQLVGRRAKASKLNEDTEVRTGFGVTPASDEYPSRDVLRHLMAPGTEIRIVWRAVQAWQLAPGDHPLKREHSWEARKTYVECHPEEVERLFQERDREFDIRGSLPGDSVRRSGSLCRRVERYVPGDSRSASDGTRHAGVQAATGQDVSAVRPGTGDRSCRFSGRFKGAVFSRRVELAAPRTVWLVVALPGEWGER